MPSYKLTSENAVAERSINNTILISNCFRVLFFTATIICLNL